MNAPARRRRRWHFYPLVAFAAMFVLLTIAGLWFVSTTLGASIALAAAGLKAEGLEGRLAGPLRARSIEFARPQFRIIAEGVVFDWSPLGIFAGRLHVTDLAADSIAIVSAPSKEPSVLPVTLQPPLTIVIDRANVKRVRLGTPAQGNEWTPTFEMTDIALQSAAGDLSWVIERFGALTPAGRVDIHGSVGAIRPFPVDLTAQLTGERDGKRYRISATAKGELAKFEALVRGEEGGVTGEATVAIEPYELQAIRRVTGKLEGIDANAFASGAPRTLISVQADIAATKDGALEGPARFVNAQAGLIDQERLPITQLQGTLRIAAPRYEVRRAVVGFAGGGTASGDIRIEGQRAEAKLQVEGVDLSAWHAKLKPTKLAGRIEAHGTAQAQRFEVALKDPRFEVAGRASIEKERLTVEEARIARGASLATLQGTMDLGGRREFDFTGDLKHVDPSAFAAAPEGDINAKLRAKGSLEPALAGEIAFDALEGRLAGLALDGHAIVTGAEKRIEKADVELTLANAKLEAKGSWGRVGDALDVKFSAADLAPIGRAFAIDIAGAINADARVTGTFAAPAGTANAKGEKLRVPGGVGFETVALRLDVGGEAESKVDGAIDATGLTNATLTGRTTLANLANVTIAGTRAQHRITMRATLPAERSLLATANDPPRESRVSIALAGGLVDKVPALTWKGRIESASVAGVSPFALVAPATLTVARDLVEVGDARLKGEFGEARFAVTRWSRSMIEARGSSEGLITRPLVRALGLAVPPRSSLVFDAQWDVKAGATIDGFARIRRLRGDVRVGEPLVALGLEELSASLEAKGGQVKAVLSIRGAQVGRIDAQASTTIRKDGDGWKLPRESPVTGTLEANVPTLRWAADWLGPEAKLEGKLQASLAMGGTLGSPTWRGRVAADGIEVRDTAFGFDIDQGTAALAFDEHELRIERFELASAWRPTKRSDRRFDNVAKSARGVITAEGRIDFAARTGAVTVRAQSYPVTQLATRFIAGTGEARVTANENEININGAFKADAGWIGIPDSAPPSLSDDVLVDRGGEAPVEERDRQRLALDLRLSLGDQLWFVGRGLSTRLTGDVRLRGEPGRTLAATGSIRTEGGTYDAYGQKLAIERGVLSFLGTMENPGLNVLAVRVGDLPVTAGVEILGTVARPDVRLYSRPDVPDHEKLSWLVLGRGPAGASEKDTATLAAAASALLGASMGNRRLLRNLGFDEVGITRGSSGNLLGTMPQSTVAGRTGTTSSTDVFTVGKRLSKDLYVSYQQGLAEAQATLRFTYQVSQRLQLLLRAGDRPGVDAIYRFTFGGGDKKN